RRRGAHEAILVHRSAARDESQGSFGRRATATAVAPGPVGATQRPVPRRTHERPRPRDHSPHRRVSEAVVSHDRTFLSRTTDRLLEVHDNGTMSDVPGGIDAWIARAAGVTVSSLPDVDDKVASTSPPTVLSGVSLGRQIRNAEKEMSRLDRRRNTLAKKILASPDRAEQAQLGTELEGVQKALGTAEEYWLTLVE